MAQQESIKPGVIGRPLRSGRPDKTAAILRAAIRLFLAAGYGATTMDAVARAAGVSKQTIYHHFGSKDALFGAIVGELRERALAPLTLSRRRTADMRSALLSLARQALDLALAPTSIALHRLIVAEAARLPEFGAVVYASGPRPAVETLAAYLRELTARGDLDVADPDLAAEQFFGMVLGHFQLRALLQTRQPATRAHRERAIAHAVDVFIAGHRPGTSG